MSKDWTQHNFTAGLNIKDKPQFLANNEFSEATNVVINSGVINAREGYTKVTALPHDVGMHGLFEYHNNTTPANDTMLYAVSTNLKNTAGSVLDATINGTNYINFSKFGNNESVYYVDGVASVKSLYNSHYTFSNNGTGLPADGLAYLYQSGTDSYAVTTSASKKVELWKLISGTWTFNKYISAATAGYWHSFCFDGTYYYAINSVTSTMWVYDGAGNYIHALSVTTTSYTDYKYNKAIFDVKTQFIFISEANKISKISRDTGFVSSVTSLAAYPSLAYFDNYIYTQISEDSFVRINTTEFTTKEYVFFKGNSIQSNKNYFRTHSTSGNFYFYDLNFRLFLVVAAGGFYDFCTSDNNVDNSCWIGSTTTIWETSKVLTSASITYTANTFVDYPVSYVSNSLYSQLPFRSGGWYFAYRLGKTSTYQNIGDLDLSKLSTPTYYYFDTAKSITISINNPMTGYDVIIWYARHETENYFYEIGSSNEAIFYPSLLNLSAVYDESTNYAPPPVGCTQIKSHRNMMVYVKDNALYYTNYFDPINTPATIASDTNAGLGGYYPIGTDNEPITAIYPFNGYLFVMKEHSRHLISGDPGELSTFRIDSYYDNIGAKNERCITDDGKFLYTFCDTGIYIFNENTVATLLSDKIKTALTSTLYAKDVKLCYHKELERVMLLVPGE